MCFKRSLCLSIFWLQLRIFLYKNFLGKRLIFLGTYLRDGEREIVSELASAAAKSRGISKGMGKNLEVVRSNIRYSLPLKNCRPCKRESHWNAKKTKKIPLLYVKFQSVSFSISIHWYSKISINILDINQHPKISIKKFLNS